MVGGATQADIQTAIGTQQTLIDSVTTEYETRIQTRINAEAELTSKRDTIVADTEATYENDIKKS